MVKILSSAFFLLSFFLLSFAKAEGKHVLRIENAENKYLSLPIEKGTASLRNPSQYAYQSKQENYSAENSVSSYDQNPITVKQSKKAEVAESKDIKLDISEVHFPIKQPIRYDWSFQGPFGLYDKEQLRRGFQIYRQTCAACHGLHYLAFRDLKDLGYKTKEIEAIAKDFQIEDGFDENGEKHMRSAQIFDYFPSPFPNDKIAALANNGAVPPDLSLMVKARAAPSQGLSFIGDIFSNYNENGADYIASFLSGYQDPPARKELIDGQYYNPYYISGESLAMPPPFIDHQIEYKDGTEETIENYAQDVAAFLTWAADPHMAKRKQIGFCVIIFICAFSLLLYVTKKQLFKDIEE